MMLLIGQVFVIDNNLYIGLIVRYFLRESKYAVLERSTKETFCLLINTIKNVVLTSYKQIKPCLDLWATLFA